MFTMCIFGFFAAIIASRFSITAGVIIAAIGIILLLLPIEGYEEKECIKVIFLIPLKTNGGIIIYHRIYSSFDSITKVRYAYDNRKAYDLGGLAYEEGYVEGDIKVYESVDCTTPVLKIFKTKPNRGLWTFAPFSTKIQYVFYIPEEKEEEDEEFIEQDVTVESL